MRKMDLHRQHTDQGEQGVSLMQNSQLNGGLKLRRNRQRSSGFSLLEVLIATTVFAFGLAGFAALLLTTIIGSAQANREGVAAMSAASLSEQISLNPVALDRYLNPPEHVSKICIDSDECTPEQQADFDFRLWQLELADRIQNARGLVCRDGTPQDGVEGNPHCDGTGPLVIKIFWSGQKYLIPRCH